LLEEEAFNSSSISSNNSNSSSSSISSSRSDDRRDGNSEGNNTFITTDIFIHPQLTTAQTAASSLLSSSTSSSSLTTHRKINFMQANNKNKHNTTHAYNLIMFMKEPRLLKSFVNSSAEILGFLEVIFKELERKNIVYIRALSKYIESNHG